MKMWSPISTFLSLLVCVYLIYFVYMINIETERQFDEQRLRYAVDYATEAGFRAALSSDDLGIDYDDMTDVKISPTNALRTFESLMCISYDMPISDANLAYIESFMPTAIVVCTDGYYVAKTTESDIELDDKINGGNFGLKWGLKIPYSVVKSALDKNDPAYDPTQAEYIAFSLKGLPLYKVSKTPDNIIVSETIDPSAAGDYASYFDKAILSEKLNKEVNLAVRLRNENFSAKDGNTDLFYVPSDFSTVRNNAIKEPSFVTMLQNVDFAGAQKLDIISVGGTKVSKKNLIVGFIPNKNKYGLKSGQKYYCPADKLPLEFANCATAYFDSMDEAAKSSYVPAVSLMSSITK